MQSTLLAQRHHLNGLHKPSPAICLQLRILDPLLRPILVQPGNHVLAILEVIKFVADALLDEDTAGMLRNNRLFVLPRQS
jgi:hypothetical protein